MEQKKGKLTALVPDLKGIDPDDSFSSVPYEKGYALLYYPESLIGIPAFEAYLKVHVSLFAHKSIKTMDFVDAFMAFCRDQGNGLDTLVAEKVDWQKWFNSPGMPPIIPTYDKSLLLACESAHKAFMSDIMSTKEVNLNSDGWTAKQKVIFLEKMLETSSQPNAVTQNHLQALKQTFSMSKIGNSEIRFRWQLLCLRCKQPAMILESVKQFISEQGRMKYVRPLYRELCKAIGAPETQKIFEPLASFYHPVAARMILKDIEKHDEKC
jgi:hypothetical protein